MFICYKETDHNGRRTQDSVLANDLYHQLTQEGFKVFFAKITLEDKLGSAYEPYIFAALNSAKVMVVLGTKPEYFNAVWVKNEWSRYLSLVKQSGGKKVLIPAYKDMDPYDLPEEFSHLQAQDMGKLGFMQDLIRGIKKLAQDEAPKAAAVIKETVVTGGRNVAPLLERAFMFLEDGGWDSADSYCEKVLDIDPKNAEAYLGKLMVELTIRRREALRDVAQPFDGSSNYQKAVRFGDSKLRDELTGAIQQINTRNETARKDAIYADAQSKMNSSQIPIVTAAEKAFASISGHRDADEQRQHCLEKIEKIKAEEEAARQEAARKAVKAKKIAMIVTPIVIAVAAFMCLLNTVILPNMQYKDALALMGSGSYTEAIAAFEAMEGYKDSVQKIEECHTAIKDIAYEKAFILMQSGSYTEAIAAFEAMGGHKDSAQKIEDCETAIKDIAYNEAVALIESGKTVEAYEAFVALDGYKDSKQKADSIIKLYIAAKVNASKVGSLITFGSYEQDNNESNGAEDIQWRVLAKEDNRALLISEYALEVMPYNTEEVDITWEDSTLRSWLNNEFCHSAFTSAEQSAISTTTVKAHKNPEYDTNPGNDTHDKIFLPSIQEVNQYFRTNETRKCVPTKYAIVQGAWTSDINKVGGKASCWWWLRSPGIYQGAAASVDDDGDFRDGGDFVDNHYGCVRPAMWIDLES